jgi:hypothetical protein
MLRKAGVLAVAIVFSSCTLSFAQTYYPREGENEYDREDEARAPGRSMLSRALTSSRPARMRLGRRAFCAIGEVTTIHAAQACGCSVIPNERGEWVLALSADRTVDGDCTCRAVCVN